MKSKNFFTKLKLHKVKIIFTLIIFVILASVIIGLTWNRINGFELELKNYSQRANLIVSFWDKDENERYAFGEQDSLLKARAPGSEKPRTRETISVRTGEWIEIKTDYLFANQDSLPLGFGFDFRDHFLSDNYQVFIDSELHSLNSENKEVIIYDFIYRFKIDSKIRLDYSEVLETIKILINILRGRGGSYDPLIHVQGHICEPKPSDPPGQCSG